MQAIKGMVQVEGGTYRIVRISPAHYDVVRVLDDTLVGSFRCGQQLLISPRSIAGDLLREIANAAIRGAKTSWVGRLSNFSSDQLPSSPRT